MSLTRYWVWLSLCTSLSEQRVTQLLEQFGTAEAIYAAPAEELGRRVNLNAQQLAQLGDKSLEPAYAVMDACQEHHIAILRLPDAGYPDLLRNIDTPPAVLYVRGRLPLWEEELFLGIVGTRHPSPYGAAVTERLSFALAKSTFVIVSGLAAGIDAAAHRGALRAGGQTVAVLGCGVDRCYPAENRRLMDDIAATGAVLSEFPPGTGVEPHHFPRRNRIISGLSAGVLVGEAPARSGALITARLALEQGRDVFAVPFPIDSPAGVGGNRLIRQGAAQLVTGPWDIAAEYAPQLRRQLDRLTVEQSWREEKPAPASAPAPASPQPSAPPPVQPDRPPAGLPEEQEQIWREVAAGAGTADEIIEQTGIHPPQVVAGITMLEIEGLLQRRDGRLHACQRK